jgi:hypothetical protein
MTGQKAAPNTTPFPARDALEFGEKVWDIMRSEHVDPQNVGVDSSELGSTF